MDRPEFIRLTMVDCISCHNPKPHIVINQSDQYIIQCPKCNTSYGKPDKSLECAVVLWNISSARQGGIFDQNYDYDYKREKPGNGKTAFEIDLTKGSLKQYGEGVVDILNKNHSTNIKEGMTKFCEDHPELGLNMNKPKGS